jgi:hypothetical protein
MIRRFIQRLIETALTKQTPVSYPDNLLLLDTVKQKSQLMPAKFEEKNCKFEEKVKIVRISLGWVFSVKEFNQ